MTIRTKSGFLAVNIAYDLKLNIGDKFPLLNERGEETKGMFIGIYDDLIKNKTVKDGELDEDGIFYFFLEIDQTIKDMTGISLI